MKKLFVTFLAVVLTMSLCVFSASAAEGDVTVTVEKVEVTVGSTDVIVVEVSVKAEGFKPVYAQFDLTYDTDVLVLDDVVEGDLWLDPKKNEPSYMLDYNDIDGEVAISAVTQEDVEDLTKTEGVLLTLEFYLADGAAAGDVSALVMSNVLIGDEDEMDVAENKLTLVDGEVAVKGDTTTTEKKDDTTTTEKKDDTTTTEKKDDTTTTVKKDDTTTTEKKDDTTTTVKKDDTTTTAKKDDTTTTAKGADTGDVAIPAAAAVVALLCGGVVVAMKKRG